MIESIESIELERVPLLLRTDAYVGEYAAEIEPVVVVELVLVVVPDPARAAA